MSAEERDELAEMAYLGNYNDRNSPGIQPLAERSDNERRRMYATADAILAAGYSKPRTITTVEELAALVDDTVIRDYDTCICERVGGGYWNVPADRAAYRDSEITLPATVLHEPKAEATR